MQVTEGIIHVQSSGKQFLKHLCMMLCAVLLSSCTGENQDLLQKFEEVRQRPGSPIEPIPDFKSRPKFAYPSYLKRRDPFFPFQTRVSTSGKKVNQVNAPDLSRPKQALERFKLPDLKMVGSLQKNGEIWALVNAPNDQVYRVRIGEFLGRDFGKVTAINTKKVVLVETYKEGRKWKKRIKEMKLNKKKIQFGKIKEE